MKPTKRRGLLRNVAVALRNRGSPAAVPVLAAALHDEEPLIRGHVAWMLGRIGTAEAIAALRGREGVEADARVREAIELALSLVERPFREAAPRHRSIPDGFDPVGSLP